jgi:hypothetical protein
MLQLDLKNRFVPARLLGETVIGDDIGANLIRSEFAQTNRRHPVHSDLLCSLDAPVPGDDHAAAIH